MKRLILLLIGIAPSLVWSQEKHDYSWLLGYAPNIPESNYGGSLLNFQTTPPDTSFFEIPFRFGANTAISDSNGELLFYTNGCEIANREHQIMANGEQISPGEIHDKQCDWGYPLWQGVLALPWPKRDNQYILLHMWQDESTLITKLLHSVVDMDTPNQLGQVITKNEPVIVDTLTDMMTSVRHANGRDWWIVVPRDFSNKYYIFRLGPEGFSEPAIQEIGESWTYQNWSGQAAFSPDGTWYARANPYNDLHLFRFDRCTGLFSMAQKFSFPNEGACGVAFSPSSEQLYVSSGLNLYQYSLISGDIDATKKLIGTYDGFLSPLPATFFQMMLAPDDKIYMSSTNTVNVLHVIHNPDKMGLACNFEQHGFTIPTYARFNIPNFPYFRLYDVPGSPCDSLGIDGPVSIRPEFSENQQSPIQMKPNPASQQCTVVLVTNRAGKWTLQNMAGQVVQQGKWPDRARSLPLNLTGIPAGVYFFSVQLKSGELASQKLIVL